MLAGLSGSADHLDSLKLLCIFRNPSFQHSFWKFTGLFAMWKQKSDTIPTSNCFQLIEEQVSKYILCPVCTPLAWTLIREMRDKTESRQLTQLPPGK